ncbi:MAG: 4Fe-4S binding protein [Candidatus Thorarchaeota archaeon]|nr:4Fe-4S binding protein [Candidatus Thorarchaeota archaeon]
MAEDAESIDEAGADEEESEPEEETPEEEMPKEKKPRKFGVGKNPLGLILNIRMFRRIFQILAFIGVNGYILLAWFHMPNVQAFWVSIWQNMPALPILAPLEAPFAVIAGSFDTMIREFSTGIFPFFTLGALLIISIVVGRAACGWICPIGTIQDFVTLPKRTKIRPSASTENELRKVKAYVFVIVAFFAVWVGFSRITGTSDALVSILGEDLAHDVFAPLNPAYILFVLLPMQEWPTGLGTLWYFQAWGWPFVQMVFVIIVFFISVWMPRWFCRWLCPAGWFYSIFSRNALIGIGRNPARCTPDTCNVCEVVCPMNIRIRKFPYKHMYSPDCILCLDCKSHCPNNAIVLRVS